MAPLESGISNLAARISRLESRRSDLSNANQLNASLKQVVGYRPVGVAWGSGRARLFGGGVGGSARFT